MASSKKHGRSTKRGSMNKVARDGAQRPVKKPASQRKSSETIWASILDDRYAVAVRRLADYRGELTIHDGHKLLHREEGGLAYGALFGPDVDDVLTWQDIAVKGHR